MATNVLDQAQNVRGVVKAARLRDSWARREANATDEAERRLYREAIFDLEHRFSDLADVPVGGAEKFARERGHGKGSRSPVHEGRQRKRPGSPPKSTSRAKPKEKSPAKRRARPTTTRRRSPAPTPRVDRAIAQTGIPTAAGSTGSVLMWGLGMTVAAGLGYLVLTTAGRGGTGSSRVEHLLKDLIPKGLGTFLNPYKDVFPSNSGPVGGGESNPDFAGTEEGGTPVYESAGFERPRPGETLKQWGKRHQAAARHRETELRRKGQGGLHR